MFATTVVDSITFSIAAAICLFGALGVVGFRNPVHNALSLVATLFGIAVLFIAQGAYFLAAVQVIVYAGAIVVLFLFVIMLLGVDRAENLVAERKVSGIVLALLLGAGTGAMVYIAYRAGLSTPTGEKSAMAALDPSNDLQVLGRAIFTDYVLAFEITSILLTVAVIGAVVLSRPAGGEPIDYEEFPDPEEDPALLVEDLGAND